MADETNTLIVRHLPAELSNEEQESLLKHFGATHVKCMGNKGRLKHVAFAAFRDHEEAEQALKRLHQLSILQTRLVVEFSKNLYQKYHPSVMGYQPVKKDQEEKQKVEEEINKELNIKKKIAENVNKFAPNFGLDYPLNPRLQYIYPPPNVSILTNIANALASVPKFYVQVLHLMNKLNLPHPFGPILPTPPLKEDPTQVSPSGNREESSEESELESDEDTKVKLSMGPAPKRQLKEKNKPRKKPKLQMLVNPPSGMSIVKSAPQKPSEIFEQPQTTVPKKIEFKLSAAIADALNTEQQQQQQIQLEIQQMQQKIKDREQEQEKDMNIENTITVQAPLESETGDLDLLTLVENQPTVEEGGFGKIEPVLKQEEETEEDVEEEWGEGEFISSRQLRKGLLSSSKMKELSVFKKYDSGEPTSRLYIKNLTKQTTDKDLHYVYGRYVNWQVEEEKIRFDIRHMKEGRMKGQAFITLPDEKKAQDALKETNGFVMHGKPMVVTFARSAKPKEKDAKK